MPTSGFLGFKAEAASESKDGPMMMSSNNQSHYNSNYTEKYDTFI